MHAENTNSALRYIEASCVESSAGELAEVEVRGTGDQKIGNLDGLLIDPVERRLRFFVVKSPGSSGARRYLLPTECPARIDPSCKSLRVDLSSGDLRDCEEFQKASVRPYSDEDFLDAMFGQRIA